MMDAYKIAVTVAAALGIATLVGINALYMPPLSTQVPDEAFVQKASQSAASTAHVGSKTPEAKSDGALPSSQSKQAGNSSNSNSKGTGSSGSASRNKDASSSASAAATGNDGRTSTQNGPAEDGIASEADYQDEVEEGADQEEGQGESFDGDSGWDDGFGQSPEEMAYDPDSEYEWDSSYPESQETYDSAQGADSNPTATQRTGTPSATATSDAGAVHGAGGSASSQPSSSNRESQPAQSEQPAQQAVEEPQRRWVDAVYKTVEHPEEGHMETVVVGERYFCLCGEEVASPDGWKQHRADFIASNGGVCNGKHVSYTKEDVTEEHWIVDMPAWSEEVLVSEGHWE